ncbi:MAG: biotin/lipoyl-binding protein, partial [Alphaproteobacteria bacterium]
MGLTGAGRGDEQEMRRRGFGLRAPGLASFARLRGSAHAAGCMRPGESLRRAAAAESDRATPRTADGHALFGGDRTVKLLARVQGYVQEIKYQDGAAVKKGTPLFVIEPEPYKVQLEQAQAAEEGAKATLTNAEAEFTRQQELQSKDVSTQANLDRARAARDTARAGVLQAQAATQT